MSDDLAVPVARWSGGRTLATGTPIDMSGPHNVFAFRDSLPADCVVIHGIDATGMMRS
jgi:hypothetical protein